MNGKLIGSLDGEVQNIALGPGKYGQAIYTDGADQYVNFGNHRDKCVANLDLCPDGLTISIWLKTGDTGEHTQYYLSSGPNAYSHGIVFMRMGGRFLVTFLSRDGSLWYLFDSQVPIDGVWSFIMMSWRRDVGAKLYVNSELRSQMSQPVYTPANENFNDFYLGQSNSNVGQEGGMAWYDDLRVYYTYKEVDTEN